MTIQRGKQKKNKEDDAMTSLSQCAGLNLEAVSKKKSKIVLSHSVLKDVIPVNWNSEDKAKTKSKQKKTGE